MIGIIPLVPGQNIIPCPIGKFLAPKERSNPRAVKMGGMPLQCPPISVYNNHAEKGITPFTEGGVVWVARFTASWQPVCVDIDSEQVRKNNSEEVGGGLLLE